MEVWTLENWSVVLVWPRGAFIQIPEHGRQALSGNVYGRTRFQSGEPMLPGESITTSPFKEYDAENDAVVTLNGSRYRLGTVDPEYEKQFPNAKERLVNSLPVIAKASVST